MATRGYRLPPCAIRGYRPPPAPCATSRVRQCLITLERACDQDGASKYSSFSLLQLLTLQETRTAQDQRKVRAQLLRMGIVVSAVLSLQLSTSGLMTDNLALIRLGLGIFRG